MNNAQVKKLQELKNSIEEAKKERSELAGRQKELKKQLSVYNLKDSKEAKTKIDKLNAEIEELEGKIDKQYSELETEYEW